jgi:hypothetical protein
MSTESNDPTGSEPTSDPGYTPDPGPSTPPPATPPPPPPAAEPPPSYQSSPSSAPAPSSAMSSFDVASVPRSVWISSGGALVLLISVFFSWYTATFSFGGRSASSSGSGWDTTDVAKLVFLCALVALVAWGLELFAPQVNLPFPAWMIAGGAGALAVLFVLFRILSKPGSDAVNAVNAFASASGAHFSIGTAWGIWLSLIAAIAVVVGAYLRMNETSS